MDWCILLYAIVQRHVGEEKPRPDRLRFQHKEPEEVYDQADANE